MKELSDYDYAKFSANERVKLTLSALVRDDLVEADRLWNTCPRFEYKSIDLQFANQLIALEIIGSMVSLSIICCVSKLEQTRQSILTLEIFIPDNEEITQKIDNLELREVTLIDELGGILDGTKLFCSDAFIDHDSFMSSLLLHELGVDLDKFILKKSDRRDAYAYEYKSLFERNWDF